MDKSEIVYLIKIGAYHFETDASIYNKKLKKAFYEFWINAVAQVPDFVKKHIERSFTWHKNAEVDLPILSKKMLQILKPLNLNLTK